MPALRTTKKKVTAKTAPARRSARITQEESIEAAVEQQVSTTCNRITTWVNQVADETPSGLLDRNDAPVARNTLAAAPAALAICYLPSASEGPSLHDFSLHSHQFDIRYRFESLQAFVETHRPEPIEQMQAFTQRLIDAGVCEMYVLTMMFKTRSLYLLPLLRSDWYLAGGLIKEWIQEIEDEEEKQRQQQKKEERRKEAAREERRRLAQY